MAETGKWHAAEAGKYSMRLGEASIMRLRQASAMWQVNGMQQRQARSM